MRHISIKGKRPDTKWLKKSNEILALLKSAPNNKVRNEIIESNKSHWGKIRNWLLQLSHKKCWYSEAKDCFSHFHVEHYRPKKNVKDENGVRGPGYWWLAFDWENYRICGSAGNPKKGDFFPLRPGSVRTLPNGDIRLEIPKILDPIDEEDPGLLSFNVEGRAIVAPHVFDQWERDRVTYTIEKCNLDFPPLMDKRRTLWEECWDRIQEYKRELEIYYTDETNGVARDRYKQALKNVRQLMREEEELSSVARACIISSGDPRVVAVLQSA